MYHPTLIEYLCDILSIPGLDISSCNPLGAFNFMYLFVRALGECFATNGASEGSLPRVQPCVFREVLLVREAPAAVGAYERSLPSVPSYVAAEV